MTRHVCITHFTQELQQASSFRQQLWAQLQQQQNSEQQAEQPQQSIDTHPSTPSFISSPEGLQSLGESLRGGSDALEDVDEVFGDASEVAARLPHALAVSSLTQQGIPDLQAVIIAMYSALAAREARAVAEAAVAVSADGVIEP